LKDICDNGNVVEKSLPKESELYVSNKFGTIKRRLTKNDNYEGEVRVSPDGTTVVYSQCSETDCGLQKINLYGKSENIPVKV
jgi:hypothetical protein